MKKLIITVLLAMPFLAKAQVPVIDGAHIGVNEASWTEQLEEDLKQYEKLKKQNASLKEYINLYYKINGYVTNGKKNDTIVKLMSAIKKRISDANKIDGSGELFNNFRIEIAALSEEMNLNNQQLQQLKQDGAGLGSIFQSDDIFGTNAQDILSQNGIDLQELLNSLGGNNNSLGNLGGGMGDMGGGMGNMGGGIGGMSGGIGGMGGSDSDNGLAQFTNVLQSLQGTMYNEYGFNASVLRMNDGERSREMDEIIENLRNIYTNIDNEVNHYQQISDNLSLLKKFLR